MFIVHTPINTVQQSRRNSRLKRAIDALVNELYGLTEEEIRIVES